jgi:phosphatidylserine/phosphatidylglycerophosphate/cardiolipin synthase-like enzyme
MKRVYLPLFIVLVVAVAVLLSNKQFRPSLPEKLPPMEVFFSPRGGCTAAIVEEIDAAKSSILVQAYSFTSKDIAKALVDSLQRGVKVNVILDSEQETANYSEADFLIHGSVPTQIDDKHSIAHNKVMIIDDFTVITGSFNFTEKAEYSNAENLLIIRDKNIAKLYADNWVAHADHSRNYERKAGQDRRSSSDRKPSKSRSDNSKNMEKGVEKAVRSLLN